MVFIVFVVSWMLIIEWLIVVFVFMYAGMFRLQCEDNVLRERERDEF